MKNKGKIEIKVQEIINTNHNGENLISFGSNQNKIKEEWSKSSGSVSWRTSS